MSRRSAVEQALDELRARVEALEAGTARSPMALIAELDGRRGPRWEQDGVRGAVTWAGATEIAGRPVVWRHDQPVPALLTGSVEGLVAPLAALGHADRLRLLQAALRRGTATTAELEAALPEAPTPGRLYHHLNELRAGGWLRQVERGRWEVPVERVVPALVALGIAAELADPQPGEG